MPTESGSFGYYKYDDDNDNDMEDNGEGGNKSASFLILPSLAAQQTQRDSNHIRYNYVNSDKHDSDTQMVDKASTVPVNKDPSGSQPPISTGNVLRDFILRSNVDRKQAMELDRLVAKLPTCKLLTTEWHQLQDLITEHAASTSQTLELMEFAHKQENSSFAPITGLVSQLKSTAKAAQPPSIHGTLKDLGQPAWLWVFSFVSYLQACNVSRLVPFVASYLRDDALAWWQSFGMQNFQLPPP